MVIQQIDQGKCPPFCAGDIQLAFTTFPDSFAQTKADRLLTWADIVDVIADARERESKEACSYIKLATFGEKHNPASTSKRPSLRYDANVHQVSGLEGDYDGELVSVDEAARRLSAEGLEAFIYTSASHTPEKPRWRVLAPLSRPYEPAERGQLMAMLNAALGGILARESFTLSQSYYYGRVKGVAYETRRVRGECVDMSLTLGEVWPTGRAPSSGTTTPPSYADATRHTREDETLEQARGRFQNLLQDDSKLAARWDGDTTGLQEGTTQRSEADHAMVGLLKARQFSLENITELMRDYAHGSDNRHQESDYQRAMQRSFERTSAVAVPPLAAANEEDFEAIDAPPAKPYLGPLESMRVSSFITSQPAARRFVVKGLVPLGVTMVLAAAGGTGKSQMALQMALSAATGEPLCGRWEVEERGASLLVLAEDERLENHRRVHNAFSRMGDEDNSPVEKQVRFAAIDENVFIKSLVGEDARLLTQEPRGGWTVHRDRVQSLIETAKSIPNLKLIVLDPASRFRAGDENDNDGATRFIGVAERILAETGATVIVTAHVNKSSARGGDDSSGAVRGASGLPDGARMTLLMRTMSDAEARTYKITPADKWRYVRVDTGKFNYGPPVHETWLRKGEGGYLEPHTATSEQEPGEAVRGGFHANETELRYSIARLVSDRTAQEEYYSERSFRTRFGGINKLLGVSERQLRSLLETMLHAGELKTVPHPAPTPTTRGGVLALGPKAPYEPETESLDAPRA
ncbi:AAA family ATPase [Paraburkholderia xenovorans]